MPWKTRSVLQAKQEFIREWMAEGVSVKKSYRSLGIPRSLSSGYIQRHMMKGMEGLESFWRAPHCV
jgi:hypothetical protein